MSYKFKSTIILVVNFLYFICLSIFSKAVATVYLMPPADTELEELNQEEKDKFQNVNYRSTSDYNVQQYKGDLKFKYGKADSHFKDGRIHLTFGGQITLPTYTTLTSNLDEQEYLNKEVKFNFKTDYNYFAGMGFYWPNGVRLEAEYSSMVLETKSFGKSFKKYGGTVFNQYLQDGATYTINLKDDKGNIYTRLTGNMQPLVEFNIRTIMVNLILEQAQAQTKVKPYLGAGAGYAIGNMRSLENKGSSRVPAFQLLAGFSYSLTDDSSLVMYLGYKYIFISKMKQDLTRITPGSPAYIGGKDVVFDPETGTYYNPVFTNSREEFKLNMHNINLGFRFFF